MPLLQRLVLLVELAMLLRHFVVIYMVLSGIVFGDFSLVLLDMALVTFDLGHMFRQVGFVRVDHGLQFSQHGEGLLMLHSPLR